MFVFLHTKPLMVKAVVLDAFFFVTLFKKKQYKTHRNSIRDASAAFQRESSVFRKTSKICKRNLSQNEKY